ncbi:MAG: MFS transporter [Candidatus Heimdallarchaeota archaeon]|nr:MFS transporter [Candidatus Heimdallarchaeota archaeon]
MDFVSDIEKQGKIPVVIDETKRTFKHFLFLFSGQQISLLGSSVVSFAIIWWLTVTTQSEMMLGIASLVSLGPYVFAAPFSGILADKANRKMLLIIIDASQALLTVTLSILFLTNNISLAIIFVILGLRGTAQAFHTPVSMSLAPSMVPQKHLSRINGLSYLFSGLINIIGPAIGAALFAIPGINIGMILWIDIATFGIALIPLLIVKIPPVVKPKQLCESPSKTSFVSQISEGFTALKGVKGMIALLFGAMIINFFFSPLLALLSLFVNKVHSGSEGNYALVVGLLQAAIVVGGLFMSFFKGFKKPVLFLVFSVLFQSLCQIALTFVPTNLPSRFWIIGSILFAFALPFAIIDVTFITSLQLMIPKEKLGRVIATVMAITPAIRPLGQFLSGVIAEFVGINAVLIVTAILGITSLVIIYLFTSLKKLDSEIQKTLKREMSKSDENEDIIGKNDDLENIVNEMNETDEDLVLMHNTQEQSEQLIQGVK